MEMMMSGSERDAARIRARQDKALRSQARLDRMARQEARDAAELAAIVQVQQKLVSEAKAAREAGEMRAPKARAPRGRPAGDGNHRSVDEVIGRLERRRISEEREREAVRAARGTNAPELGHRAVDDPYEPGAKMMVVVNLAEHPLERMLSRRHLSQEEYEAGVRFRMIYEKATIGPGRGIDPGKIKVDGGRLVDPVTDAVLHAQGELKLILPHLGQRGSAIVIAVCGLGKSISELAPGYDMFERERSNRDFISGRLRDALQTLAKDIWGATGPMHGRIVSERGLGSGVVDMKAVDAANQFHLRKRGIEF